MASLLCFHGYQIFVTATVLWAVSAVSCAEFGFVPRQNFTQGLKFRGERNAIWDSPFRGAIYVPGDVSSLRGTYSLQRGDRNVEVTVEFRPLCETVTRRVELSDGEHEFRPPYYHEKICRSYGEGETTAAGNQMCMFSCVQRTETVYLTRRRFVDNCWETFTKTVPSSCECMWPEPKYSPTG